MKLDATMQRKCAKVRSAVRFSANGKRIGRPPMFTPEERAAREIKSRRLRDRERLKKLTPEQKGRRREADARYKKRIPHDGAYLARVREYVRKSRQKRLAEMTPAELEKCAQKKREYNQSYVLSATQKEAARARSKEWSEANKDRREELRRRWAEQNPSAYRTYAANRRARKRAQAGVISKGIAERLFVAQRGRCAACRKSIARGYELDHVVPIALGGAHDDMNLQLLCVHCNRSKGCKAPAVFANERGMLL